MSESSIAAYLLFLRNSMRIARERSNDIQAVHTITGISAFIIISVIFALFIIAIIMLFWRYK